MFKEEDSLVWIRSIAMAEGKEDPPAIMIVAVDMQDLLALDTQDTTFMSVGLDRISAAETVPRKDTFGQSCA
jgi:hypothetical protein